MLDTLRSALRGLDLVLVGGDARIDQIERLRRTFDLRAVVHRATHQNDPSSRLFESALGGRNVALAVWLSGLSRTSHGKRLRLICNEFGIPWVDCPRIPHPNLLAARIQELRLLDAIARRRDDVLKSLRTGGGQ